MLTKNLFQYDLFEGNRGGELLELYRVYKSGQGDPALMNESIADFYTSRCDGDLSEKALQHFERYGSLEEYFAKLIVEFAYKISQLGALSKCKRKHKKSYSNFIELTLVADAVGAMFDIYLPKQMARDVQHPIWKDLDRIFSEFAENKITPQAFRISLYELKLEDGTSLMSRSGFVRLFIGSYSEIYVDVQARVRSQVGEMPVSEKLAYFVTTICLSEMLDNMYEALCVLGPGIKTVFNRRASQSHKRYKNVKYRFERGLDA